MSTADIRISLVEAEALATTLVDTLRASCARIELAGSIRRRRPDIGDIEIVAIPKVARRTDLFGEPAGTWNLLEDRLTWLVEAGELAPRLDVNDRPRLGPKYKALTYCGAAVDLFLTTPECWGVIYTIRTGPADFSHRLVTPRQQGGLLPNHLRVREGRLVGTDGQPLDTPEEESVFAAIGLPYSPPEERR